MANSLTTFPFVVIDTFTSAIDLKSSRGMPSGSRFALNYIEWQEPAVVADGAVLTDDDDLDIFNETCVTATQSIIKYFHGCKVSNIKMAASGVASGKINIMFWTK